MQFPDLNEVIFDSASWPIPSGDAFAVQPAELVVVLARNFYLQKLTAGAAPCDLQTSRQLVRLHLNGASQGRIIPKFHA
jgi:hypothetical protein